MSADRRAENSTDAKNRNIPKLAKKGHHENRISGFQNEQSRWILNNSLPEAFKWQIWTDTD